MNRDKALEFYSQFVHAEDMTFDIGAGAYADDESCGDRAEIFRALGARVVAVEPQRQSIEYLKKRFGDDRMVVLVEKAVSNSSQKFEQLWEMRRERVVMATMNPSFIDWCERSQLFGSGDWKPRNVELVTLDSLISEHGEPAFIKIDVEAYEDCVVSGLSTAVKGISFEFHPHDRMRSYEVMKHLCRLANYEFNFSLYEELRFYHPWMDIGDIMRLISALVTDPKIYGDVYARMVVM